MHDYFENFHKLALKKTAIRIILITMASLIIMGIIIDQRLILDTVAVQTAFMRGTISTDIRSYLLLCLLNEANSLLLDFLNAALRYHLNSHADSLFIASVLRLKDNLGENRQPGACLEEYRIKKTATLNFYEYSSYIIPKHLLLFLNALYQTSVCSSSKLTKSVIAIFLSMLSLYFLSFYSFLILRKRVRTKIIKSALNIAVRIDKAFSSFDCIKALGLESVFLEKYKFMVRINLALTSFYHIASEFFRLLMRSTIEFAKILMVSSIYFGLGFVHPSNLMIVLLWIRTIDRSLLNLRNALAMHIEYKHESAFVDPAPAIHQRAKAACFKHISQGRSSTIEEAPPQPRRVPKSGSNAGENAYFYHENVTPQCAHVFAAGVLFADVRVPIQLSKNSVGTPETVTISHNIESTMKIRDFDVSVLNVPSLRLAPGQITCIVGAESVIKSAIADCLLGFTEYGGTIEVGGQNIRTISDYARLRGISYLPDRQELFSKSILFNISYGTGLSEKQAIQRANQLGFGEIFSDFPNGYHTVVNDNGYGLSSGERQMICLCRTLIKECSLYILDNPASFLDYKRKEIIYDIISKMKERMVLVFQPDESPSYCFDNTIVL